MKERFFFGGKMIITPIYSRDKMPFNFSLNGPAIIEQMDTTTLIEPGDFAYGDDFGNIFIEVGINK
jgi:N-methylhydantoinase A